MRLILLGPPGCGKGTQAHLLCERQDFAHIGTGDLLRAAIRDQTPLGLKAKAFVEAGELVPDELVNDLIADRFSRPDRPNHFVMDGYPRTLAQAQAFDAILRGQGFRLHGAVLFDVSDAEILRRVTGRWSCPSAGCKATYNTQSNPPRVPGICDVCGTPLVQRADDREETVRQRLVVYHRDTAALIPYYRDQGLLHTVPGQGDIEQVYANLMQVLNTQVCRAC
jgi:adenylate kinase